ncbi:hypothetical protein Y1Q_0009140 [Alligator mississippiensis]|uniref:Uncharacterized protein n=1 Tax=Alligator mississippiensis TaxID=8496 RepID=A0A151M2K6_ALLMI|nr:hypothetical protein Y1Q_0009140 [Alligator mississippiensis]
MKGNCSPNSSYYFSEVYRVQTVLRAGSLRTAKSEHNRMLSAMRWIPALYRQSGSNWFAQVSASSLFPAVSSCPLNFNHCSLSMNMVYLCQPTHTHSQGHWMTQVSSTELFAYII